MDRRLFCLISSAALAACTGAGAGNVAAPGIEAIAGRRWVVEGIQPSAQPPGSWRGADLTLEASSSTAGGSGGCNRWSAGFASAAPGEIRFTAAAATMMACADTGVMEREREFLQLLERMARFRLEAGKLLLEGEAGERITLAAASP